MASTQAGGLVAGNRALWGRGEAPLERPNAPDGFQVDRSVSALATPVAALPTDLAREVYCLLGIPVDAIDMTGIIQRIKVAAATRSPFLISTPNLNFLIGSRHNVDFRESLLTSDLCPADGMPLVWIAKLTGIPIKQRVAGSDVFETLRAERDPARRLKVYFFGGDEGAALAAAKALNATACGWFGVGSMNPGFGNVEAMSTDAIIDEINGSGADFLVVALGATKGQAWLQRNHHRLRVPVRAHLGAALNFLSGRIRRAPPWMRTGGLEWLWRIKEEPHLWKRYAKDGAALVGLMVSHVLPLAIVTRWNRLRRSTEQQGLAIETVRRDADVFVRLSGTATEKHIKQAISTFVHVVSSRPRAVTIDVSNLSAVDARFLGLLLILWKLLRVQNVSLTMKGASRRLRTMFRLQGVGYLLSSQSV